MSSFGELESLGDGRLIMSPALGLSDHYRR
jgi:hypothetical protein